jgi:alpha-L-fucosidase 2
VIRLTADKTGALSFTLRLSRQGGKAEIIASGNDIMMNEHIGDGIGVKMTARLKLITEGGTTKSGGDSIRVDKADAVTIFLTAATDYFGKDPRIVTEGQLSAGAGMNYLNE